MDKVVEYGSGIINRCTLLVRFPTAGNIRFVPSREDDSVVADSAVFLERDDGRPVGINRTARHKPHARHRAVKRRAALGNGKPVVVRIRRRCDRARHRAVEHDFAPACLRNLACKHDIIVDDKRRTLFDMDVRPIRKRQRRASERIRLSSRCRIVCERGKRRRRVNRRRRVVGKPRKVANTIDLPRGRSGTNRHRSRTKGIGSCCIVCAIHHKPFHVKRLSTAKRKAAGGGEDNDLRIFQDCTRITAGCRIDVHDRVVVLNHDLCRPVQCRRLDIKLSTARHADRSRVGVRSSRRERSSVRSRHHEPARTFNRSTHNGQIVARHVKYSITILPRKANC